MNNLTLATQCASSVTLLSNIFIDCYMPHANGEFVKVYIYLLRCVADRQDTVSVSAMADFFNQTEADVLRALRYWDKTGAIRLATDPDGQELTGVVFCELSASDAAAQQLFPGGAAVTDYTAVDVQAAPEAPKAGAAVKPMRVVPVTVETRTVSRAGNAYTPKQIKEFSAQDDFSMLLYAVGAYMGGTLSPSEASAIAYFYDTLHFPSDLIEYLIEYCVSKGHKSMRYIEKVALAWAEAGICTVKEAKAQTCAHSETAFSVMHAFGITNRDAGQRERDYIHKWTDVYCFDCDIIIEACNRTLKATHQPSFEYADSILSKWQSANVRTFDDIQKADAAYEQKRTAKTGVKPAAQNAGNRFNHFHQRDTDIDSLESSLLSNKG